MKRETWEDIKLVLMLPLILIGLIAWGFSGRKT